MHDVVKANRMLRNPQADGRRLATRAPPLRLRRIQRAALAGIDRRLLIRQLLPAIALQFLLRAEAQIRLALAQQPLRMLAINRQPVALAIRRIRAADIRPFVPIQPQPLQVLEQLRLEARLAALHVGVFDAQDHTPPAWRANSQLNSAVRALPTCSCPWAKAQTEPEPAKIAHTLMLTRAAEKGAISRRRDAVRDAANTVCFGAGIGTFPFAARHKIAFRTFVSAASACEKSSLADCFAPGAFAALA